MRVFLVSLLAGLAGTFSLPSHAEPKSHMRAGLGEVLGDGFRHRRGRRLRTPSPESNYLLNASWGRRYSDTLFGLPIPMSANIGLQYFKERDYQDDGYGITAYIKAHYDWELPWTDLHLRLGLGEGLSYVTTIPMSEQRDFAKKDAESKKLLNYLEWTIDLPLAQFAALHRCSSRARSRTCRWVSRSGTARASSASWAPSRAASTSWASASKRDSTRGVQK